MDIKVVLFCGGKGTRMWPISKVGHPKQFDVLLGKQSFFRDSLERVLSGFSPKDIFISTGIGFKDIIKNQAGELPSENIIYEPEMRDNLGAVALAAATINYRFPDSVMVLLWGADHYVKKKKEFIKAIKLAAELAYKNEVIVHIDIKPSYPSVHNGWIKIGKKIKETKGFAVYEFVKQVEKPDLTKAKKFLHSGNYLIHTGYMAVKPSLLLQKYQKYAPSCYKQIKKISMSFGQNNYQEVLKREYAKIEKVSVDFGLFVKLPPGTQWEIPVDIGWIDLGTWELLYQGLAKDKNGNVVLGNVELLETKKSLIISKDKKIAGIIGLEEMIVVDTDQGLLVCPLAKASLVKQLYQKIYEKK